MAAHAAQANRVYPGGSFIEILAFRWQETVRFILPLLVLILPQTAGLMLTGAAAWRAGILKEPQRYRRQLRDAALGTGALAAAFTLTGDYYQAGIPLACCYATSLLLWLSPARAAGIAAPFAALGRMAFTNYLAQSVILGLIFYGYGLGLFAQLTAAAAADIGIAIYIAQAAFSMVWLHSFRFGPAEWLWRSLTYGRLPRMRVGL
jgi:uncharacterized protein